LFYPLSPGVLSKVTRFQNWVTKCDPNRSSPERQPSFLIIETVAAQYNAWYYRDISQISQHGYTGSSWCPFQDRVLTIPDSSLRENAYDPGIPQAVDRATNSRAVGSIPVSRERVNRAQEPAQDRNRKKFRHRHPINFSPNNSGNYERIEMADVIRGEQ
jgi:hypothetical protein